VSCLSDLWTVLLLKTSSLMSYIQLCLSVPHIPLLTISLEPHPSRSPKLVIQFFIHFRTLSQLSWNNIPDILYNCFNDSISSFFLIRSYSLTITPAFIYFHSPLPSCLCFSIPLFPYFIFSGVAAATNKLPNDQSRLLPYNEPWFHGKISRQQVTNYIPTIFSVDLETILRETC